MAAVQSSRVFSGTHATLWVDDEEVAALKAFQLKLTYNKSDVLQCGTMFQDKKVVSVNGTGSITVEKCDSFFIEKFAGKIIDGHDYRVSITIKLNDPDARGIEQISVDNVSFDEITLADVTAGSLVEHTFPFTFASEPIFHTLIA